MATPLTCFQARRDDDWLIGLDHRRFVEQVEKRSQRLAAVVQQGAWPKILLMESDPIAFLAGFLAAAIAECPVFLGNPNWTETEYQTALDLAHPNLIWRDGITVSNVSTVSNSQVTDPSSNAKGWIMIPTGGTSGRIRFVIHTWSTLMASVQGFRQHFQVERVHSYCVLPLYHVSGLMQFLRSFSSGGRLMVRPSKTLEQECSTEFDPTEFFLSLVPTQLQRSLQIPQQAHWLARFRTVLLGGAPAWDELLEQARQHQIRLAPTYGMTETASQIATLHPDAFLSGNSSSGTVLPHACITICDAAGQSLESNQIGRVTIQAESLALGYYPVLFSSAAPFEVDDLGFLNRQDYLTIVGRRSHKIITGGENVFPEEVEAAIQATNLVEDVGVVGMPDRYWGEVIVAIYRPKHGAEVKAIAPETWRFLLSRTLAKFKHPKYWVAVEQLPRNAQGKLNREQLKQIATEQINRAPITG